MEGNFNKLSAAEMERLALLSEELGEAQQAIGKIMRHGYASIHPDGGPTNKEFLEKELGDVMFSYTFMASQGDVDLMKIAQHSAQKGYSVGPYLHHNSGIKGQL